MTALATAPRPADDTAAAAALRGGAVRQAPGPGAPRLVRFAGVQPYAQTWDAMRAFTDARNADTADELWCVEHPSTYTVGVAGRAEHLPRVDRGIPVVRIDRGGQVTWHGPGQAIVYTLVDLRRVGWNVRTLVRTLEGAVIDLLAAHGVAAAGDVDRPGVYVDGAKVAALGLKIRRGCAYHGVSVNVDCALDAFAAIDPCGHRGLRVTNLRALGLGVTLDAVFAGLADRLADRFTLPARAGDARVAGRTPTA